MAKCSKCPEDWSSMLLPIPQQISPAQCQSSGVRNVTLCHSQGFRLFVCLHGRPRQAMDVIQPAGLLYRLLWTFQLWPPDAPAPTDAFCTLAAEVGTYGRRTGREFCLNADFHGTFRDLLHAANLWHGIHGFTSLPKEGVLRIFLPLKIWWLRPGLNLRTWALTRLVFADFS
jgi:hypothetical protein